MADNRTMEELLQAPTEGYGEAIVIPEMNADHFEIKTNLLQLVQANPFHGFERENPHTHINNFKRITSTLKFRDVPNDVIKLMMFPYSLEGAASSLYNKVPLNAIVDWEESPKIPLNENCSEKLLKKLPESLENPARFLIPWWISQNRCDIPSLRSSLDELALFAHFHREMEDYLEEEPTPTTGETSAPPAPKTTKQLAARTNQERVKGINNDFEVKPVNYALMAISSSSSSSSSDIEITSDDEHIPKNDRFSKNGYKAVPPPITWNFLTPRADISFAELNEYDIRNKIIESQTTELNNKTIGDCRVQNMTTARTRAVVNTGKGKLNNVNLKDQNGFKRPRETYMDHLSKDMDHIMLMKDPAVVDSGCSSHMTGNKAYLSDYEDFNGGFVAFGSDPKGESINKKRFISKRIKVPLGIHTAGPQATSLTRIPMLEDEQVLHDKLEKMATQELTAKAMDDVSRQAFEEEKRRIAS
ncbi:hypothetical protein Tco_1174595 [Tanacetum coccineum]